MALPTYTGWGVGAGVQLVISSMSWSKAANPLHRLMLYPAV